MTKRIARYFKYKMIIDHRNVNILQRILNKKQTSYVFLQKLHQYYFNTNLITIGTYKKNALS